MAHHSCRSAANGHLRLNWEVEGREEARESNGTVIRNGPPYQSKDKVAQSLGISWNGDSKGAKVRCSAT